MPNRAIVIHGHHMISHSKKKSYILLRAIFLGATREALPHASASRYFVAEKTRGSCWYRAVPHIKLCSEVRSSYEKERSAICTPLTIMSPCLSLATSHHMHVQGQNHRTQKQNKHGELELIFLCAFSTFLISLSLSLSNAQ